MAKKKVSAYEMPTPEKVAMGARLRTAREMAGMSQGDAAEKLGYSQAVQLSLMEAGKRPVNLERLIQCASLYGTTMDYLCGLAPDVDRDPAVSVQRELTARLSADLQSLVAELAHRSVDVARNVMPTTSDGSRMAAQALEAHAALLRVMELNPKWQAMKGGSLLQSRMEVLASTARAYSSHVERGRRLMAVRSTRTDDRDGHAGAQVSLIPLLETGVKA